MKAVKYITVLALLISAGILTAGAAYGQEDEEAAVKTALKGFYASLNLMFEGDATAAEEVWSHSDDVVYMGADGAYNRGWEETYANWKKQAALKLGGQVEPVDVVLTVGEDIAVTHQYVKGVNTNIDGERKDATLRASSAFRKEDGKWKMIGHHVDVIPELGKELHGE